MEFSNADEMLQQVREDNYYGEPMAIVLYKDSGIPISTFAEMDPLPN